MTSTSGGTATRKAVTSSEATCVPVGLLGLQTATTRAVAAAAARPSRSTTPARSGTGTGSQPAYVHASGYMTKLGHGKAARSPAPATTRQAKVMTSVLPAP